MTNTSSPESTKTINEATQKEIISCRVHTQFTSQGYLSPVTILPTASAVSTLLQNVTTKYQTFLLHHSIPWSTGRFKPHLLLPTVHALLRNPTLIATCRDALGLFDPEIQGLSVWSTDIVIKKARSEGYFPLHQDSTYAGMFPPEKVVTVWVALTECHVANGCLHVVPCSNALGQLTHVVDKSTSATNSLLLHRQSCVVPDGFDVVPMVLKPGQATLFSFMTVHSSPANRSNDDRVGLAIRVFDSSVVRRSVKDVKEMVTHLWGREPPKDAFDMEEAPVVEFGDKELRMWRESIRRENENYGAGLDGL